MKKMIVMAAFIIGCSLSAGAQHTQIKPTKKPGELKTEKKGSNIKQTVVLKSTSENTANAPLILPLPKHEVDTTFLPVIRNSNRRR